MLIKSPDGNSYCTIRDYFHWYIWPKLWPIVSRREYNRVCAIIEELSREKQILALRYEELGNKLHYHNIRSDREIAAELAPGARWQCSHCNSIWSIGTLCGKCLTAPVDLEREGVRRG